MRIYIAGPMSGLPNHNAAAFDQAASDLRRMGHEVVSPVELDRMNGLPLDHPNTDEVYQSLIKEDIRLLLDCDAIAMLPGWSHSKGAALEHRVAVITGKVVIYQKDGKWVMPYGWRKVIDAPAAKDKDDS